MRVRFPVLLAVYTIVPLCLAVIAYDQFFLGGYAKSVLPRTPDALFLYALVFVIPHIVASFFSFADSDYLTFYQRLFRVDLPIVVALALALYSFVPVAAFFVYIAYTEYHTVAQQTGLGRFYFKARLPEFPAWKWSAIAASVVAYVYVYRGTVLPAAITDTYALPLLLLLLVPFIILSFLMLTHIRASEGKWYVLAYAGSVCACAGMLVAGYPLLAVLATRVLHDVPAFMAYTVHDFNRAQETGKNVLYRMLTWTRIPLIVLAPVLAVGIAFLLARTPFVAGPVLYAIAILHYYVEGFIWKGGSLHRQYLRFA